MEYNFSDIERRWQAYWAQNGTYKVTEDASKPKFYVLDMFPYPSGAGLHVGHPLGYIASDIYSRYKRLKGFNVLHPMGYDAFGLPAEQYAIQTGQHPDITTKQNIARYREQLDKLGFSYDWSREIRTCDPAYYRWTQWAFIQMFNHYYCYDEQQARPIAELIEAFEQVGSLPLNVACGEQLRFTADEWKAMSENDRLRTLLNYRIAYKGDTMVNWCPALGTVLANDEVIDGLSERGGYPVEQKIMSQWCLRVSAYAQRLLDGLDKIDWTDSLKEIQRGWIGRSEGAEMRFEVSPLTPKGGMKPPTPEGGVNAAPTEGTSAQNPNSYGYQTARTSSYGLLKQLKEENRKNQTQAESVLWNFLSGKQLDGYKFRRQHVIDQFIVDFVCLAQKLIVEVDGGYHNDPTVAEADTMRTAELESMGYRVIRFTNDEVLANIENVQQQIKAALTSSPAKLSGEQNTPLRGDGGLLLVFTTRPDTIFGVTFMVLAPESDYVPMLVTPEQQAAVDAYLDQVKRRTERERIADRRVTGVATGSYAINPLSGEEIPIWISDYVLAGYGTGAIMAVPAHDSRDYAFAKHFNLPIIPLIEGCDVSEESFDAKEGIMMNSGFLNGLTVPEAIAQVKQHIEEHQLGHVKVNYRLRDAIFSRQRYWGEPFPVYYKGDAPYMVDEKDLPIVLPEVDKFLPTETGEPPLGRAKNWTYKGQPLELCTMPGFAGSSAYYLRYMDPKNDKALVSKEAVEYWQNVDLYLGGTEHATGHLIYSRFWNKFLFDLGIIPQDEPFKKLINQGMIQGRSNFVYRIKGTNTFVSKGLIEQHDVTPIHVDVNIVENDVLDTEAFRQWRPEYANAEFILEDGKYHCGFGVEKMSKSLYNVVNPDTIAERYGADTLRMYEMFLGPLEQSKPWDTKGIDGVHRFLRKFWRLFHNEANELALSNEQASDKEMKTLHKTIKKVQSDIESFSFNTAVSAFMICVNELTDLKCGKREVLEPLTILLSSFAPHICEELWAQLGNTTSITTATYPVYDDKYLVENVFDYPVSFNGKVRFKKQLPLTLSPAEVEKEVLADEAATRWLEGNTPKKVIVVQGKIVNIVM